MRPENVLAAVLVAFFVATVAPPAQADPCADGGELWPRRADGGDDEGGIGGTGHAGTPDEGLGGTGMRRDTAQADGIGGTGVEGDEGGIGGTGIEHARAETAIRGTITGYASLCIGGTEVQLAPGTTISIDGRPASIAQLDIGEFVDVVALRHGDAVRAVEVVSQALVVGPVTVGAGSSTTVEVAGQRVLVAPSTWGPGGPVAMSDLQNWGHVRVAGLRRPDGAIDATRIDPADATSVLVRGRLERGANADTWTVAGTPLAVRTALPPPGAEVKVVGRWLKGWLEVDSVQTVRPWQETQRARRVEIEGYLEMRPDEPTARIEGVPVDLSATNAAPWVGRRVKVVGDAAATGVVSARSVLPVRPRAAVPRPPRPPDVSVGRNTGAPRAGIAVPPPRGGAHRAGGAPPRIAPARRPKGVRAPKPPPRPPQVHRPPARGGGMKPPPPPPPRPPR